MQVKWLTCVVRRTGWPPPNNAPLASAGNLPRRWWRETGGAGIVQLGTPILMYFVPGRIVWVPSADADHAVPGIIGVGGTAGR
jgi:hypothetical protein